jgi:hypothetical protein
MMLAHGACHTSSMAEQLGSYRGQPDLGSLWSACSTCVHPVLSEDRQANACAERVRKLQRCHLALLSPDFLSTREASNAQAGVPANNGTSTQSPVRLMNTCESLASGQPQSELDFPRVHAATRFVRVQAPDAEQDDRQWATSSQGAWYVFVPICYNIEEASDRGIAGLDWDVVEAASSPEAQLMDIDEVCSL